MRMKIQFIMHVAAKRKIAADKTRAKHATSEEQEPCTVDKIEHMLDEKFFDKSNSSQ